MMWGENLYMGSVQGPSKNALKENSDKDQGQAASHTKWIEDNVPLARGCKIIPVLVTPVCEIEKEVASRLKDVLVWPLADFRAWVRTAVQTVRPVRRTFQGHGDLV